VRVPLALLLLAACSTSAGPPTGDLSGLLLDQPPAGYALGPGYSGGRLTLTDAAASSIADRSTKKKLLQRLHYSGGAARIWHADEAYVSVVAFRVDHPEEVVAFELAQARQYVGTFTFDVPGVPGAVGFQIAGSRRGPRTTLYCYSVWFPREGQAFNLSDCAPAPASGYLVSQLAKQQLAKPLPAASVTPSPPSTS
jgi:hypothetical protein